MKKVLALVLMTAMTLGLVACGGKKEDPNAKSEGVMTYAEYEAAAIDSQVTIEAYVMDKQSWWDNTATVYTADGEGAYFLYNMACSEEDYAKLTKGTKIKVTGYKAAWSGEVEIADATFEIEEGNYVPEAVDLTSIVGKDEAINYQNRYGKFTDMVIADAGNGEAFMYNWDGSGSDGDDLYFNATNADGVTVSFCIESYLRDNTTDVYKAVTALKVGDKVDMEGFLYWYEGPQPHIISVKVK